MCASNNGRGAMYSPRMTLSDGILERCRCSPVRGCDKGRPMWAAFVCSVLKSWVPRCCKPDFVPADPRGLAGRLHSSGRFRDPAANTTVQRTRDRRTGRPLPVGLAPEWVYHAADITAGAVGSYPTFSPLPRGPKPARRYILCGTFRRRVLTRAAPAFEGNPALWCPDFPPV